jgi:hypothetical protein
MLSGFTVQMRYMMCLLSRFRSSITISVHVPGKFIEITPENIKVFTEGRGISFENLEALNNYLAQELK